MEPGPPGSEEVTAENANNKMRERELTFYLLSIEPDYWVTR